MITLFARQCVRYLFFPLLLIVAVGVNLALLSRFEVKDFPLITAMISFASIPIVIAAEYFLPYRKGWLKSHGDFWADFLHTAFTIPTIVRAVEVFITSALLGVSIWLRNRWAHEFWPTDWPLLLQFTLAVVIAEFGFYWVHRLCHEFPTLWKMHSVHHGSLRVYWLNSGKFHPLEHLATVPAMIAPLVLLGTPPEVMSLVWTFNSVHGFLEHANVDYEIGPLNFIFNSAQLHRWHHSQIVAESNQNYAKTLIIWDALFGTRFLPKNREVETLGVTGKISVPQTYFAQLWHPFKS